MVDFQKATGESVAEAFEPRVKRDKTTGEIVKDGRGRPIKIQSIDPLHLVTLVWLTARKTNPGFSFEDAMNWPVSELDLTSVEESDPKG
jgi:hypothetical protein